MENVFRLFGEIAIRNDEANRALVKDEEKAGIIMGLSNPMMTLLMNMGITVVVALSSWSS